MKPTYIVHFLFIFLVAYFIGVYYPTTGNVVANKVKGWIPGL